METRARYIIVGVFSILCAAAIVAFLVWLQNAGSFGARREVLVKFHGPVPGLQAGVPVAFNGIKIGEVVQVGFERGDPGAVDALLSVASDAPLNADTGVTLQSEGLLGSVYVALAGGAADKPLVKQPGQRYPELSAPASQSLPEQARATLSALKGVVSDNSKPLHDIVANAQTFAAMLARNSPKIEDILNGLAKLAGGSGSQATAVKTFDLQVPSSFPGFRPGPPVQLVVADPTALVAFDTQRLLTRAPSGQLSPTNSQWPDSIPKLVQRKTLDALSAARFRFASPPTDGLNPNFELFIVVRDFQIDQSNPAKANVRLSVRLQDQAGKIVAQDEFGSEVPASATDGPEAVQAMNAAFGQSLVKLTVWCRNTISSLPPPPPNAGKLEPPPLPPPPLPPDKP